MEKSLREHVFFSRRSNSLWQTAVLVPFFAMFNLAELLSKTVPLPHIPSLWQTTPKVDKWIFLTLIWSFQTCEVPGPNSDGRIWNEQQMARIDEERKMTKLSGAGEAIIINHAFHFRGERSSKTRANICSLQRLTKSNVLIRMHIHMYFKIWRDAIIFPKANNLKLLLNFILFILIKSKSAQINLSSKRRGVMTICYIKDLIYSFSSAVPFSSTESSASFTAKCCVLILSLLFFCFFLGGVFTAAFQI